MKVQVLGTSLFIDVEIENVKNYISNGISSNGYFSMSRDNAIDYLTRFHNDKVQGGDINYISNFKTMLNKNQVIEFSILEG